MRMVQKRAVLIAGPTASGKSALALALSRRTGAAIVNADSMQIYRDLRIITARPTEAEEREAPHLLYGHVDAAERYSAGSWLKDAARVLDEAKTPPVFVGGTGLYFSALLKGLSSIPPVSDAVRAAVAAEVEGKEPAALHEILAREDAETAAQLRPSDRQRILRALEVFRATGRGLASWQREPGRPVLLPGEYDAIFLQTDRDALARRIDARFDKMLEEGALDEVRSLATRNLDPKLSAMKAHGVPWLIRHLRGEVSLDEAAHHGKLETRQYSKRQETWFRNQLPEFRWVRPEEALAIVAP